MGFAEDLLSFKTKALEAANSSVCNAAESLFTGVVDLSPIQPAAQFATGLLKNSYYTAIDGGFDLSVGSVPDSNGTSSLSRIKATVLLKPFLGKDNTITLTNSVPEAYRANALGWPMGQGANGWIWSGRVKAYRFVETAVLNFKGAYS